MAKVARFRSSSRKRTVAYAVGAAVLVLLLVAGLAFANSISVTRVTNNARSLHWTNATMGTSALTRAGLVQAVTFAELQESAVVQPADLHFAMSQVTSSFEELEHLVAIGEGHDSYSSLTDFMGPVSVAVGQLQAGEVQEAKETITVQLEASYIDLVDSLEMEQDTIQTAIEDNSEDGRALNKWIVFILTLAVPGSAVLVYFVIARRQVRVFQERNRLELEAERTISRAKDAFIAGLSHELRTPLTSIYGFAEILTDGGVQGREATGETARIIANEAAEMTRMVDDLLAASRLESTGIEIELSDTVVGEVIESAILPFARAGMKVNRDHTDAVVVTDSSRLRHVLINLLSNAARYGGPLTGIEVTEADGMVEIEVWDDGPGVPEDRVATLFDRFAHDGDAPLLMGSVGLGLAVASRITTLMGGKLRYQRFGARTSFVVSLPIAADVEDGQSDEPDQSMPATPTVRALST